MTPRQIRRVAEREARKTESKQPQAAVAPTPIPFEPTAQLKPPSPKPSSPPTAPTPSIQRVQQVMPERKKFPKPRHPRPCRRFRHLRLGRCEQFKELVASLYDEHQPVTDSERRLVDSMTQHFWLIQRAITLQDKLLTAPELDHKTFGLFLRYQPPTNASITAPNASLSLSVKNKPNNKMALNRKSASKTRTKPKSASPTP